MVKTILKIPRVIIIFLAFILVPVLVGEWMLAETVKTTAFNVESVCQQTRVIVQKPVETPTATPSPTLRPTFVRPTVAPTVTK